MNFRNRLKDQKKRIRNRRERTCETLEARYVLDSTVVFNEIMYNPIEEGDQQLEWIELYNQLAVDMDISEWVLDGGVNYTFPDKTVVPGRGHLIVAADPAAVAQQDAFPTALGPWEGRLNNNGEELRLYNNDNRLMNTVTFGDNGDWPVGPDGGGVSLVKGDQFSASHMAENWTFSARVGGTPGIDNFIKPGTFIFQDIMPEGSPASAIVPTDDSNGLDWIQPGFDDSGWLQGTTGVGHESSRAGTYDRFLGLDLDAPPNGQQPAPFEDVSASVYMRFPFTLPEDGNFDSLNLRMRYDDGFIAYLNGVEVARDRAPENATWDSIAESSHRDSDAIVFVDFPLNDHFDKLQPGENILAIHGMNQSVTGNDSLFYPVIQAGNEIFPDEIISIAFNEIAAAEGDNFFVEIVNHDDVEIDLSRLKIVNEGEQVSTYNFAAEMLQPGEMKSLDAAALGFQSGNNDFLGIYTTDGSQLVDARRVTNSLRGMSNGMWQYPTTATPGTANNVEISSDIVINEIMYHALPNIGTPDTLPTFSKEIIIPVDGVWNYNDTGVDLGLDWEGQIYASGQDGWKSGPGMIGYDTSTLPEEIRTELARPSTNDPGFLTYYFQTNFEVTQATMDAADAFQFRHLVDDGAIFYLNGQEIHRFNMAAGDITADMDSLRTTRNAEYSEPLNIPKDLLTVGNNVISAEVHISSTSSSDITFGAEVYYGEQLTPFVAGTDFSRSDEEWIEFHNKGDQAIDLTGWRVRDGISFDFPDGTTLDAGGYLLIAGNAESLQAKYPDVAISGEFSGTLGNRDDNIQLYDARDNLADEVHYYEGGRWESFADGGGSTLELSDPNADNSKAEVWNASYEGDKSEWLEYSFVGTSLEDIAGGSARFNEFVFGLLDAGQFLIDDVEVIENGTTQHLQNGTFEDDTLGEEPDKWRLIGNHIGTVIVDPTNPDNKVLHVDATGAQSHVHDHAETTFTNNEDINDGASYELKFRAKWLAGNSQLNSRLYFSRLSNTAVLPVPENVGTPGAQNSNFVENTGPVFDDLQQFPATPLENQQADISVAIADPDGLQSVKLWYHVDEQPWESVDMTAAAGGIFQAQTPGYNSGDVVQFYVEATDNAGLTSHYPEGGPDSRALYQVEDGRNARSAIDRIRLVMLDSDRRELFSNVDRMSNRVLPATLVHNDTIYHNIGVRQTGSRWIRPNSGYKVFMNTETAFYGVHDTIRLDLNGMAEIMMKQMVNRAGIGQNSMYDDLAYLVSPNNAHTHEVLLNLARYENIYLDEQFGDSSGTKFELDDVTFPTAPSGGIEGEKTNTDVNTSRDIGGNGNLVNQQGANPEFYRAHVLIKSQRAQDDFQSIVRMAQAIHLDEDEGLFDAANEVMDVDLWMRHYANQAYLGNWDTYGFRRPKNLRLYVRPDDQKVIPLFWDCDLCNFSEPIFNRTEATSRLDEIRAIPNNLRLFWGHLHHYMDKSFNEEYVSVWATHYGEKAANQQHGGDESFSTIISSTRTRTASVTNSLNDAIPPVDFSITTNDGNALNVDTNTLVLNGKGWVNVREIYLDGVDQPLSVFWPETDVWEVTLPLSEGENALKLNAFDFDGNPLASDEIVVTSTEGNSVIDALRVTEINYNPASPTAAESAAGFDDNDEFEFIELSNISDQPVSLENVSFQRVDVDNDQEGIDIDLGAGKITELQPGERVVIVENTAAFEARYGADLPVTGQWSGQLSNNAETISLFVNGVAVQSFRYEDWYDSTDGNGSTLEIFDVNAGIEAWSTEAGWRAGVTSGGTPGTASVLPGDSNGDGIFNSADLVQVSQAGEYEDGIEGNSTFAEGDWNGDGEFDSRDIVLAFIFGAYSKEAIAANRLSSDDVQGRDAANLLNIDSDLEAEQLLIPDVDRQQELAAATVDQLFNRQDQNEVVEETDEAFVV